MSKSIFYSAITGKALENPVVFDGYLCDRTEAEKIQALNNPGLDRNNNIVDNNNNNIRSLAWVKEALTRHGDLVPAKFLQGLIDVSYNESAWPRPSALNQYNVIMTQNQAMQISQPAVVVNALKTIFSDQINNRNNANHFQVVANTKNKRAAEVLNKYGVIANPVVTANTLQIQNLNLQALIRQAEHARIMMLNMRRVLITTPSAVTLTDEVKLQHKIINGLSALDKPLIARGEIQRTATIEDALALLHAFSKVQDIATTRIYPGLFGNDSAHDWHMLIAENEGLNSVEEYIQPFQNQYNAQIAPYTDDNDDAENFIKNGEYARQTLLRLKPLSEKQTDMGFNYTTGHDWSNPLKAQRALVDSLGAPASRLSESLLSNHLPEATRLERAKMYQDTLRAIHTISAAVVNNNAIVGRGPRVGERAWHEMIAAPSADFTPATVWARVEQRATGQAPTNDPLQYITVENPFEAYLSRNPQALTGLNVCSLTGMPTDAPVIFLDGYVYDGNALDAYLRAGNRISPVTKENFETIINPWNLNTLPTHLMPVSRAILQVMENARFQQQQQAGNPFLLQASAPPEDDFFTNKPASPLTYDNADNYNNNNNQHDLNDFAALQGLLPMAARITLNNNVITIHPALEDYAGYTGTYKTVNYDGKSLYWENAQKKMSEQLDYLKEQGIIAGYALPIANAPDQSVTLFGFNQESLTEKGNAARALLHAVKTTTETNAAFTRRLASGQRSGMNPIQDNGQLPDHVHYQRRNIVGESSRLSAQTRNDLGVEITDQNNQAAFECLACAKEVITFGAQGARSNHSYVFSPINTLVLRTQRTCDWYNIFQSNIEKTYTDYGHYEITKAQPYDFAAITDAIGRWAHPPVTTLNHQLT